MNNYDFWAAYFALLGYVSLHSGAHMLALSLFCIAGMFVIRAILKEKQSP